MNLSRRSMLKVGGASLVGSAAAGCLSEPGGDAGNGDATPEGYAAFFTLWDWAEQITGDAMSFENPIEAGEMGHGWEPPADIQRDIAGTDVFVYLDTAEFSWAQDVASDLESDTDVALIDGMAGLEGDLLPIDRGVDDDREPDDDHEFDLDDLSIAAFDVYDRQRGTEVAYWHGDHWHGSLPDVPLDGSAAVEGVFEDGEGRVLPLGENEQFQLDATFPDLAEGDVVEIESRGDHVVFHGLRVDTDRVVFELVSDGEVVWDTGEDNMTIEVVEEIDEDDAPDFYDPHVWVDPVLAQEVVETIADGLARIDPDNAETYEENAAAYADRLAAVDDQLEELAAEADRDVAVLAGHDSFQYIEHRYGFELHTPVGISPDAAETESDIAETIEIVEEHDIETILYDPFETPNPDEVPQMVELLLENTDATDYAPLSPAEGTTSEWNERGWGWIEQMEELNIPSLRNALGAAQ
ncbi:metal ABC transporter solute-binding protein, Zn/Mn family [Natrarchaeobius oligotrophus]|uniref:Zinc ABC transporter substrate-binding protein n=1 Tax=Natrarchaeobius chitinivorans TaxID=1679083 RepID=A0A3N6NSF2_NATCH|nr:zinc ABC transporter substrate-binding protein [Natrarchaeobius chitinivorans]RQH03153.1 zinc ABC transporter substrate-binding protein [Natrarchaeobius chitinivorans]